MAINIGEENLTRIVLERNQCKNERSQEIMDKLIQHLHAFIKDLEPTEAEWWKAIHFLTRTGQKCDDKRQEFILLSDVLGVSMLVDAINHRNGTGVTESTVTGPFHARSDAFPNGENIAKGEEANRGEAMVVHGQITDQDGLPVSGAHVDVWQCDDVGYYDIQDVNQPEVNLRGVFETNEKGEFWFRSIKPSAYPIPYDGPVGDLLKYTQRSPMRPAHIHFWIKANGFQDLVTHIFVEGDPYIDSDAVFGVKESLILPFVLNHNPADALKWNTVTPFYEVHYDFKLPVQK